MLEFSRRQSPAGNDHDENIMTDRTTELEIKVAHLEQSIQEMSDTVYAQQTNIDTLTRICEVLRQRIMTIETPAGSAGGDEKPPHY